MDACWAAIKSKFDADSVFSYSTVKLVVIKDKKLGLMHHFLQFGIFVYIVLYTIIYQQRYLLLEVPYGQVRATLREPDNGWINANTLPYCTQNQPSYAGHPNFPCAYITGTDMTFPPAQQNSILVTTRVKDTYFSENPNCSSSYAPPTSFDCVPSKTILNTTRYYMAGIEEYTLFMEHAIFGRQNEIVVSNSQCDGKLVLRNGSSAVDFSLPNRTGDVVLMSTLLSAAQIPSLDEPSGLQENWRYDGALVVVVISYTNYVTDPSKLKYEYELYTIPKQDVVNMQPSQAVPGATVQRNWYGIRFVFLVVGSIGHFDFPTLLTSLMNGMVLIKVATVVVDMLILYIMPDKREYSKHKFETTNSFKKLKKKKRETNSMETGLLTDDYGSMASYEPEIK